MAPGEAKWWHVEDREVEHLVAAALRDGTSKHAPTVVTAATRPPKLRRSCSSPEPEGGAGETTAGELRIATSAARPPRPRVTPGTPLLSHRGASPTPRGTPTPRSRPTSSCRSPSSSHLADGKITVYVHNIHSSDKLVLRVHPEIKLGSSFHMADAFADLDGRSIAPDERQTSVASATFKSMIAHILAVAAPQVRLAFRGTPLSGSEKTLRCYGVEDGDTLHLRLRQLSAAERREVSAEDGDPPPGLRPYALQSPSSRSRLDARCEAQGAVLQPKWVWQGNPKLFAPVGVGMDGHGGDRAYEKFNEQGIWIPPVDHVNQRGANQYGLQRVRESRSAAGGA